jgi:hypothetical protein
MLAVLSEMSLERLPFWLREFLVLTTWPLEQHGRSYGLPGHQALRAMRRRLLAVPAAEAVLEDFDVTERARALAAQTGHDIMFGAAPW